MTPWGNISPHVPLAGCIVHVFRSRAEKQMIWSHARRIVAVVADIQAVRNRSIRQFPRDPMRIGDTSQAAPATDRSIFPVGAPRPYPALAGLVDFRPETFFNRYHLFAHRS
jgi:hypothetical protein